MPQLLTAGPLGEIDAYHRFRLKPDATFHFLGRERLSPAPRAQFWKVDEWALCCPEVLDLGEYLAARRGNKSGANARGKV
jgi:hypothetical protein